MLVCGIINAHAAPNLKQSFRLHSQGDTMHDLRNHATDLVITSKTKKGILAKGVLNTMELSIGIVYQMKQRMRTPFLHLRGL